MHLSSEVRTVLFYILLISGSLRCSNSEFSHLIGKNAFLFMLQPLLPISITTEKIKTLFLEQRELKQSTAL